MNIDHLSVSRMQLWKLCQQAYKYKYHQKMPSLEDEPIYFAYGSIVHKIAEVYTQSKGEVLINEIAADVMSGKIPLDDNKPIPKLPAEYRAKLPEHVRSIKRIADQIGFEGFTEWEFNYDLDPPNNKIVMGYIDRLVQKDDRFWILDYKTTKKGWFRKNANTIGSDLQLRTYARVIQKTFNAKPEKIKTGLYYLEGGDLIGASFTDESLDSVEAELLQCYLDIENKDPNSVRGNVGKHCERCDYRQVCPFYS